MTGYNKATSDPRGLFNRFLPPTWRNTDSSNIVHNAIIKSIANTLVTAESDLLDAKAESYLETSSGVFLDKWGSFSGITRRTDETDDHYRARIKRWFTKKKGTVNSLIENVKEEFEDIDVYIYEPWRNIFYTNKSVLNGVDRLQGFYYRFAVIDIHISSTVDVKKLAKLVDRYKDAGVIVYFTYETGLSITTDVYDITMNVNRFTGTEADDSLVGRKQTNFPLGQPRDDITDADLFKTNDSNINGEDVLSGNPLRGKVTYNSAGAAIVAKKYTTDMTMADAMVGVEEYDNAIYGASNNADGITYTIENAESTVYSKELLDAIFSSVSFSFNPTFNYAYDTSKVTKELKYYVDVILNNTTFSYNSSTNTISRITAQITSESPVVYNMLNTVASKLNVYVDNIGDVRLVTTYDDKLSTKYNDFLKLYTLSIDPLTGELSYTKNTGVSLEALSEDDKDEIYRVTGFDVTEDGILAYTTKDSDIPEIKAIVNSTKLVINSEGVLVGSLPTIDLTDNTLYTISRDTFFIFDWLAFIKQNESDLFLDNSARYIRITTKGSQYGFNMRRVEIMTETGVDISNMAKWTNVGEDSVNLLNGTVMAYPSVSTRSYTMDLGQVSKLATITLTDNYASNVKRVIEVSEDGVTYHKVGQVYSRGGDVVDVNSFNNIQAIGIWLNNHTTSNELTYSLKDIITSTDISLYDFSNEQWGNSILLPKGDAKGSVSVDSSRIISDKGLSVVRVTSTKTPYRLDMLKFKTGWL